MSTKYKVILTMLITAIFGGISYISLLHNCGPAFAVSFIVGIYLIIAVWGLQPRLPDTCQRCYRDTDPYELISNSKYGSYEFKQICASCANKYDKMNDDYKQERG